VAPAPASPAFWGFISAFGVIDCRPYRPLCEIDIDTDIHNTFFEIENTLCDFHDNLDDVDDKLGHVHDTVPG
jgi:hypothetical protein